MRTFNIVPQIALFILSIVMVCSMIFNFLLPTSYASSSPFKQEKISFQSGTGEYKETLSGTVLVPNSPGPHPAIVLVHGAGAGLQEELQKEAEVFAKAGLITLIYDKRTKGYSKTVRSFSLLADDVLAGVQTLSSRSDVNPKKVGLWGFSEGGWVAPLAASKSKQVAFVITIGAPGVTPLQQQTWNLENRLDHYGITSNAMIQSIARNGARFMYSANLFPEANYDPIPVLKLLKQPILALWGNKDRQVPPAESSQILAKSLEESGNDHYTIQFLTGANHGGYNNTNDGFTSLETFAPGYEQAMITWLDKVLKGNPPTSKIMGKTPIQERLSPSEVTKLHWYDSHWLQLGMIIFFLVVFLSNFLLKIVHRKSNSSTTMPSSLQKSARYLAISGLVSVLLFWGYLLLIWVFGGQIVSFVVVGRPVIWILIQFFAIVTCLLTICLAFIWWSNRSKIVDLDRVRLSLVLIGGILFIPWAVYWQLVFP